MQARTRGSARVWWTSPIGAVGLLCPLTLLVAWRTSNQVFQEEYTETKSLTGTTVLLAAAALVTLGLGAGLPLLAKRRRSAPQQWPDPSSGLFAVLRVAEPYVFGLTLVGYLSFVLIGISNGLTPRLLVSAIVQQNVAADDLKAVFGSVTGITSLTQVGMAYSVVAGLLLARGRDRSVVFRLTFLLLLALVRSYLVAERLAFIEVVVPILVIGVTRAGARGHHRSGVLARAAPLLLFPLLFVGFGALEYSRSYAFYGPRTHQSLAVFTLQRLTGYYVTAYNNGQLALNYMHFPGRLPYGVMQGFWTAPGITQLGGYQRATGVDYGGFFSQILSLHGNPEFNSPGGVLEPFVDLGLIGGFLFLLVVGLVLGALYEGYVAGDTLGLLLYPSLVTGMFELPRYLYWTEGRFTPSVAVLVGLTWLDRKARTSAAASVRGDLALQRSGAMPGPPPAPAASALSFGGLGPERSMRAIERQAISVGDKSQ